MALDSPLIAPSPADPLLAKLDDPRVTEALSDLLEHADLLALLVVGLDGMLRRGDEVTGAISDVVGQLRDGGLNEKLSSLDLPRLAESLSTLSSLASEAGPALDSLLKAGLTDPRLIDVVSVATRSVITGAEKAKVEPVRASGVFSLMRALKDEDVARGLSFLIQVARAFGQEIKDA